MRKPHSALFVIAACLALGACRKDEPAPVDPAATEVVEDLPPGQPPTPPIEPPADAVMPVTVSADAVAVGSSQGPDQMATTPKASYALGDTVYASARTGNYPKGAIARVYWTYSDGVSHKEEEKKISGDVIDFSFTQADGMKAGKYNVEIDVNDVPVGIVDFVVK